MSYIMLLIFTTTGIGGTITTQHSLPMKSAQICKISSETLLEDMAEQNADVMPKVYCIATKNKG